MRKTYTITFYPESGTETTATFHSKAKAKEYCEAIGMKYRGEVLHVAISVQAESTQGQSIEFVKAARA
jgi:hypothetical protein